LKDNILQILILIPEGIHLFIINFGFPIFLLWKGGKLLTSILLCWGLHIIWAIIWCVILPGIASNVSHDLALKFPEAIGVFPIILTGWLPSVVVCTLAYAIIKIIKSRRSEFPNSQIK
jgi:hypothetical protein